MKRLAQVTNNLPTPDFVEEIKTLTSDAIPIFFEAKSFLDVTFGHYSFAIVTYPPHHSVNFKGKFMAKSRVIVIIDNGDLRKTLIHELYHMMAYEDNDDIMIGKQGEDLLNYLADTFDAVQEIVSKVYTYVSSKSLFDQPPANLEFLQVRKLI